MAIVLDFRRPKYAVRTGGDIAYGAMAPDTAVRRAAQLAYSDRLVRFIAVAPLLASILLAVVQLTNITGSPGRILLLITLGVALMVPHLHHLWPWRRQSNHGPAAGPLP